MNKRQAGINRVIRIEAIGPFAIFAGLVGLYFILLFDGHLRRGLEWASTRANGAEVNVAGLKTSFARASIEVTGIEFTDPSRPSHNRLKIGRIDFRLLWDALLRGKAVIELAGVNGLDAQTPRKRPGRVLPPSKDSPESQLAAQLREKLSASPLGELARVIEGFDPVQEIKDLGNLKSVQHVDSLRKELGTKQAEWTNSLQALPGDRELASLKARLGSVKLGGNPAQLPAQIKLIESIVADSQKHVTVVQSTADGLTSDVKRFQGEMGAIDDWVAKDREELESRLKLPSIDPKTLSKQMFGDLVLHRVEQAQGAVEKVKQYMPPRKKGDSKPSFVRQPRGVGRTYEFGRPQGYPLFWLKRATFSSAQNLRGELTNVTTAPAQIGVPARLSLDGDFTESGIKGVSVRALVDATGESFSASLVTKVASFPVSSHALSDSEQLRFVISEASGAMGVEGRFQADEGVDLKLSGAYRQARYEVKSTSKVLGDLVRGVAESVPEVNLSARVSGTLGNPDVSIDSNLAQALGSGLARQLQAQLVQARAKLDAMIRGQVDAKRAELQKQFDAAKAQATAKLDSVRKQVDALQAEARSKIAQAQKQAQSAVRSKALESLKKKLPF